MARLDPEKLSVQYREGVTATEPIIPRRYTLTHSDITAELYLIIGREYAADQISAVRDEVLGEWTEQEKGFHYHVYLYVDGGPGSGIAEVRNYIFRQELPLALEAIRFGDKRFFEAHPVLDYSPIIVFFLSEDPKYNKIEYWGTFELYNMI